MDDIGGFLCVLLIVLAVITVMGHGLWLLVAAILRWLLAEPPKKKGFDLYCSYCGAGVPSGSSRCPVCGKEKHAQATSTTWRDDLQATYRQLERLRNREQLGEDEHRMLVERLRAFEESMQAGKAAAAGPVPPTVQRAQKKEAVPTAPPESDRGQPQPRMQPPVG